MRICATIRLENWVIWDGELDWKMVRVIELNESPRERGERWET